MRKTLLMTLSLMLCTGAAGADNIGVFADQSAVSCELGTLAPPPGNNAMYIIHQFNANGTSASQFKVNDTTGLFATSQTTTFLTIGTWNTDLSVAYGGCLNGDIIVMTLNFLWFGSPITDCNHRLAVVAAPTTPIPGEVATVECDFNTLTPASGSHLVVNTNATPGVCCLIAATESQTWGGVKALYR